MTGTKKPIKLKIAEQPEFDFGDRFAEVANKEMDKHVVTLLKALANMGVNDNVTVNKIMDIISIEVPDVRYHTSTD